MDKLQSIGGLWKTASKDGKRYLSGNIDIDSLRYRLLVFPNTYKQEGDAKPDFSIMLKEVVERPQAPAPKADNFEDDPFA